MDILIAATKSCHHRSILVRKLTDWGVDHRVMYFEDHPELVEQFGLQASPLLVIDGEVASVGMPDLNELKERLDKQRSGQDEE